MGLLGKLTKRGVSDDDEDDDDDLGTQDEAEFEDSDSDSGGLKAGLMGRFRGLRNFRKSGDDDDEDDDDWDSQGLMNEGDLGSSQWASGDAAAEPQGDEDLAEVQVVRLEGVPDVRVVGESGESSTSAGPQPGNAPAPGGQRASVGGGSGASSGESVSASTAIDPGQATENRGGSGNAAAEGGAGLGLDLKDIFEEQEEVDEVLKDLAESMEDVSARELADDLKEFFDELEASMPGTK